MDYSSYPRNDVLCIDMFCYYYINDILIVYKCQLKIEVVRLISIVTRFVFVNYLFSSIRGGFIEKKSTSLWSLCRDCQR